MMFPPTTGAGSSVEAMSCGVPSASSEPWFEALGSPLLFVSVLCPQAPATDPLGVAPEDEPDEVNEVEKEEPPNEDAWEEEFAPPPKLEPPPDTGFPKLDTPACAVRAALRHRVFKLPINVPPGPR